jgi:hypothetical protein
MLASRRRDGCTIMLFVIAIRPPRGDKASSLAPWNPHCNQKHPLGMTDGNITPLAMELAVVFSLQDRTVEHFDDTDEIDALAREIIDTPAFLPLEHCRSRSTSAEGLCTIPRGFGERGRFRTRRD